MDAPRRRFSRYERAVLFLVADGCCTECGALLEPGWHGDHVQPYSRNGPTDITNGQALCPPCNLTKGNSVVGTFKPRAWQSAAIATYNRKSAEGSRDFLFCATPGAGKTKLALHLACELIGKGIVERVLVVVPTDSLRRQWCDEAAGFGLDLCPLTDGADGFTRAEGSEFHGGVMTYQQLANPRSATVPFARRYISRNRTVVILDEIHHAGEGGNETWGPAVREAFEHAERRILLSGTPWRTRRTSSIPFVEYDQDGRARVDYAYGYGQAVSDRVCRHVDFHAYDGTVEWRASDWDNVVARQLTTPELADRETGSRLSAALDARHVFLPELIAAGVADLDAVREMIPDAGGLLIADDQRHARQCAEILENLTGVPPMLAVSDEADARATIERFRTNRVPWLVAVKMVSEGVDIPRLLVGVYATRSRTPLFFRQVVGRFVRVRPNEDAHAKLVIPAVPALTRLAKAIMEEIRDSVSTKPKDPDNGGDGTGVGGGGGGPVTVDVVSAGGATLHGSIWDGEEMTGVDFEALAVEMQKRQIPRSLLRPVAHMMRQRGLELATITTIVPGAAAPDPVVIVAAPEPPKVPKYRIHEQLRREFSDAIKRVVNLLNGQMSHEDAHRFVMRELRVPRVKDRDEQQLRASVAFAQEWARNVEARNNG